MIQFQHVNEGQNVKQYDKASNVNNDQERMERKKRMIVGLLLEVKRLERGIRELEQEQEQKVSRVSRVKQQQSKKGQVVKRTIQLCINSSEVSQSIQLISKENSSICKQNNSPQQSQKLITPLPIAQSPITQSPPTQLLQQPITTNPSKQPVDIISPQHKTQKQSQLVIQIRDLKTMVQRLQSKLLLKSQPQQHHVQQTSSAIISGHQQGGMQQQSKQFIRSNNNFMYGDGDGHHYHQQQARRGDNSQSVEKGMFRRRDGSKRRREIEVGKIVNVADRYGLGNSRNRGNHNRHQQDQQQKPQNPLIKQQLSTSRVSSASKLITRTQSQRSQPQSLLRKKSSLIKQTAFDKLNPKLVIQEKNNPRAALQQKTPSQVIQSKQQISRQLKSRRRKSLNNNRERKDVKGLDRDNLLEKRQSQHEMLEFNISKEKYELPPQQSQVFNSNLNVKSTTASIKPSLETIPKSIEQAQVLFPLIPTLPPGPTPSTTQAQLYQLAIDLFSLLGHKDVDKQGDGLIVEKYRNCVYFGVDQERNILWHYDKGKMYFGGWRRNQKGEGEKHGQGWEFCQGKYLYSGEWREGKREGLGVLRTYAGDYEDKVKQEGVIKSTSLHNSNQRQRNSLQPPITSVYIGHFQQNRKHGQGLLLQAHSTYYHGQFHLNKKQGLGKCLTPNGNFYEGTFLNNLYQGHGTEKFSNGDQYRGEYHQGKFQGKGWYRWGNGAEYEGGFSRGKRNGMGVWRHGDEMYEGEYQQDRKCGVGVYRWGNGAWYRGGFKEDVRHEVGMTRYENGKVAVIEWQWGRSVRKLQQQEWPQEFRQYNTIGVNANNIQQHITKARINTVQISNNKKLPTRAPHHSPSKQLLLLPNRPNPVPALLQQQSPSQLQQSHTTLNLPQRRRSNNQRLLMTGQQLKQAEYQPIGRSTTTRWQ